MVVPQAGRQGPITCESPLVLRICKVESPLLCGREDVIWTKFDYLAERNRETAGRQSKVSALTYIVNSVLSRTHAGKNIVVGDTAVQAGQLRMHTVFGKADFVEDAVGKGSTKSAGWVDTSIMAVSVISPPTEMTAHIPVSREIWSVIE